MRCLVVINLPNTIEKLSILEYLQTKKKILSDRTVALSQVITKVLSFFCLFCLLHIFKRIVSQIHKCYTKAILDVELRTRREIIYETIV